MKLIEDTKELSSDLGEIIEKAKEDKAILNGEIAEAESVTVENGIIEKTE